MLVEVTNLNFGRDSVVRFELIKILKLQVFWKCRCLVEILKLMLGRYSEDEF